MGSGIGKRANDNALSALQRIARAEGQIALLNEDRMKFIEAINGVIAQQREKLSTIEGVVNAIVDVLDKTTSNLVASKTLTISPGTVLETLKTHLAIRKAAQVERDKAAIATLTENGSLVASEEIAEDSLIVGEELNDKDGGPGWVQMEFGNVLEEFQALLIGKHVGDEVLLGAHTLVVKEIYKIVPTVDVPSASEAPPVPTEEAPGTGYVAQTFAEAQIPADNATAEVA